MPTIPLLMIDIAKIFLVFSIFLPSLSAKSKPISGKVISNSGNYLKNVSIESLPSSSKATTDKQGVFSFLMPVKDRKIKFSLNGYHTITLNAISFTNDTEVELVKVIEVNYLDSINTSIKFILSREGENITSHEMNDMLQKGFNRIESILHWDNSFITYFTMDGFRKPFVDGTPIDEVNMLYGSVKVNNISNPIDDLGLISERGISEFIITDGGHSKFSALSESIHYIPNMAYENKLAFSGYQNSLNNLGLDGYGSIGIKHATIHGGFKQRDHFSFYADSSRTQIRSTGHNYFSNIGLTNRKNLEISFSGFQNTKDKYNLKNKDSLWTQDNTFITKVDQWSPLTGRIRIHGLYQERKGLNHNLLDSLHLFDKCQSLGFSVEKDFKNYMLAFATTSKIINSDWDLIAGNLLIDRQNSIFTWSIESFLEPNRNQAYVKDLKFVFSKERTTDVKDPTSQVDIAPNYWDDHSFKFSTKIMQKKDDESSVYLAFGRSSQIPYLEDVIKSNIYSNSIYDEKPLSNEKKTSFEVIFTKSVNFEKYSWSYMWKVRAFNQLYKSKIKQVPLTGNSMTLPINAGKVSRSGLVFNFKLQPITHRLQFTTTFSFFASSDHLKFQLMPENVMKNQIFIHNRYFNIELMALASGKRNLTYLDDSNLFAVHELQRDTNYSLKVSKMVRYKMFDVLLSLMGENLSDNVILFDDIRINEQRYSFDATISIQ